MYEDKTAEQLQTEMLETIDGSYQKSIGFPTFDLTKAFAQAFAQFYQKLSFLAKKLDVENLNGDELNRFVKQRKGVERKVATYAKGVLTVFGNGGIQKGDLFETSGGAQFQSVESKQIAIEGAVSIQAVLPGAGSNVGTGAITMLPKTIQGIAACINLDLIVGGYEAETDDSLRERYYEAIRQPPTSGNKYHYVRWAREVAGVGDAKVFPLWQGDNTVQVVIVNDDSLPADDELIGRVQDYIDPNGTGRGEGQAPIGARCTVNGAEGLDITVTVGIRAAENYSLSELEKSISESITAYLQTAAFKQDYISYGKIANAINDAAGVEDFSDLQINGSVSNIEIGSKQVAVLGMVNVNVF